MRPVCKRVVRDPIRYKTTPCKNGWKNPDKCSYGWRCQHAHDENELRPRIRHSPPAPPPSAVQSPVCVIINTLDPSHFQLNETILPPLPPEPPPLPPKPPPLPLDDSNETLDYLDAILAAMQFLAVPHD